VTGFSRNARNSMMVRSKGGCELCFFGRVEQFHHRRPRGMGSTRRPETNLPSNGLAICEPCHRMVESNRAQALASGWLVPQRVDPMSVPILRHGRSGLCSTTTAASKHPCPTGGRRDEKEAPTDPTVAEAPSADLAVTGGHLPPL